MYVPIPSALSPVLWRPVLLGAFFLALTIAPMGLAEDRASSAGAKAPPEAAVNENESVPLTDAQQAAKQLAATLEDERPTAAPSSPSPATVPLAEPGLRDRRFIFKIYTSDHIEVVVMGGQPTLASPVNSDAVDDSDARRPTLRHAEEGAVAIGVFLE